MILSSTFKPAVSAGAPRKTSLIMAKVGSISFGFWELSPFTDCPYEEPETGNLPATLFEAYEAWTSCKPFSILDINSFQSFRSRMICTLVWRTTHSRQLSPKLLNRRLCTHFEVCRCHLWGNRQVYSGSYSCQPHAINIFSYEPSGVYSRVREPETYALENKTQRADLLFNALLFRVEFH